MLNLQFSDQTKPTAVKARQKDPLDIFSESLNQQIELVKLLQAGETLTQTKRRYVSGKRVEVDVEVRPWFWQNDHDQFLLTPRYSSQPIHINNHPSIHCGPDLPSVQAVLNHLKEALTDRDATLTEAIHEARRKTQWGKNHG
ncbi:hypothetical protein GCM10011332_31570 [Terasakiella brassicae]|uniref:Uncharacterized protein n=1 Tax=Terasakiella brassicae TaxID=1634917 RepID=A0A917CAA0_9PROT|nr:hypothetical protein [Terasakiella brassicae]GGF75249.1 hypothetical protein GCM10011332_31570 [Terasakiella brassicae]